VEFRRKDPVVLNSTITENQPDVPAFVPWFDPVYEGVAVETADGGVRAKAVVGGKPFAKAGLRVGDVIAAVNGEVTDSPESFRRLLRRAWVGQTAPVLRVVRQGRSLEIRVPVPPG
jgi:S1-C subfamily serine protease